ncbi:ABC transporter substrate-binding protein [Spirulina sp. CS-785/01]|uniref:ABC transporter substrate-binding protein n=1 Tax=Spirulina sp. CS-785/01 TaxID=3021716 RepID=UPI00232E40D9|nr:ABC transporter substrate-binding protein [Spirulina sp. CS-785/01]MDB9314795.1 ABC transporter substrate-binding protein [Spirulina sp. CS-785/01]
MAKLREIKILIGTLGITAAILGGGFWVIKDRFLGNQARDPNSSSTEETLPAQITAGSTILFADPSEEKQQAAAAYNQANYAEAETLFQAALAESPNDPETVIYYNNAQLLAQADADYYTIAVVVPARVKDDQNKAAGILRGVAQVQQQINQSATQINGKGLKVIIADDANSLSEARKVAQKLVQDEEILAVIGHYSSGTTEAALSVYQDNQMVLLSASSTSDTFSTFCESQADCVFFRTIANNQKSVDFFAEQLIENARRATIFYSFNSDYSQSFQENFQTLYPRQGGTVVELGQTDLSKAGFNPSQVLEEAGQQGVEGLVLVPDGGTSAASLRNAIALMETNQGQLWVAGSSSLYNAAVLEALADDSEQVYNTFTAYTPWHHTTGCNTPSGQQFCREAQQVWGTKFVSWRTATAYDGTRALEAALKLLPRDNNNHRQLRQQLRNILADGNFETQGATGVVAFDEGTHNRTDPPLEMVRIRSCPSASYGLAFVPSEYNSAEDAGLSCN